MAWDFRGWGSRFLMASVRDMQFGQSYAQDEDDNEEADEQAAGGEDGEPADPEQLAHGCRFSAR